MWKTKGFYINYFNIKAVIVLFLTLTLKNKIKSLWCHFNCFEKTEYVVLTFYLKYHEENAIIPIFNLKSKWTFVAAKLLFKLDF